MTDESKENLPQVQVGFSFQEKGEVSGMRGDTNASI